MEFTVLWGWQLLVSWNRPFVVGTDQTHDDPPLAAGAAFSMYGTSRAAPLFNSDSESDSDGETRSQEGVRHTRRQEERQADGGSGDDEEPGEQHGGRSELGARQELSATGAQDAPT